MRVLEGRAFFRGGLEPLAVGIEGGRIVRIAKVLAGEDRADYGDRLLLPGAVDLHVHFREPGETDAEDFGSGTAAAAVGGVTTVLDMPNNRPPVTSRAAYETKLTAVRRKAHVDFGLYAGLRSAGDVRAFAGIAPAGKVYMAPSPGGLEVTTASTWEAIVAAAADAGLRLAVHAEDPRLLAAEPASSLPGHNRARPPEAEASAIRALHEATHALPRPPRIHVAHLTSQAGLDALAATGFTAEVTPHHLFLDYAKPLGTLGKVNPPLRTAVNREALWKALVEGRVPAVASDHAPRTLEEKGKPFADAPPGVPGVETMVPLLLRRVKSGDLSLERFVGITAQGPTDIAGLDGGAIDVGRPANLIVVDARDLATIRAKALHSKCGWTPFEGFEAVFPQATYLRGELVAEGREIVAERLGRPIPVAKPS